MGAGSRVAAGARRALLHREGAEATQLDAVAARHGGHNLVEDSVDDVLDVTLIEVRVLRRNVLNEFGLDHYRHPLSPANITSRSLRRGRVPKGQQTVKIEPLDFGDGAQALEPARQRREPGRIE